jgi:hypothetical protein
MLGFSEGKVGRAMRCYGGRVLDYAFIFLVTRRGAVGVRGMVREGEGLRSSSRN